MAAVFAILGWDMISAPVSRAVTGGLMYNPWKGSALSEGGNWGDHIGRSSGGGNDYPFGSGTHIVAPATGTLRKTGGSGEFLAGDAGGAGTRYILELDNPVNRVLDAVAGEGGGPLVALAFQHLSSGQPSGHYNAGSHVVTSGDTGDGPAHFHIHGLNSSGQRLRFLAFINADGPGVPSAATSGNGEDMPIVIRLGSTGSWPGTYSVSQGFIRRWNMSTADSQNRIADAQFLAATWNPSGEIEDVTMAKFRAILDALDIPHADPGTPATSALPLSPETQWSRMEQIRAAVAP